MNKFLLSSFVATLIGGSLFAGIKKWEITPMVGKKIYNYSDDKPRFDDSKVVLGGRVNAYFNDTVSLQLGVEGSKDNPFYKPGRVDAKTDILRGMVSVQKDIPNRSRVTPYVFGGLGGEKVYKTEKSTNLDSQMFYNGGVGLKYDVNNKVDLVAETRVIHKVEDQDTDLIGNVGVGFKFGGSSHQKAKTLDDLRAQLPKTTKPKVAAPVALPAEPVAAVEAAPEVEPEGIIVGSLDEKEQAVSGEVVDSGCASEDITAGCPADRGNAGVESGYYVQVISLARNSTDKITSKLDSKGFGYTFENAGSRTRVLVGPYASKGAARRALRKLKRIKRDSFIVSR